MFHAIETSYNGIFTIESCSMKEKKSNHTKVFLVVALGTSLLTGCATQLVTVTDNMVLYPANQPAEKWGIIKHFEQYPSRQQPQLSLTLPNGKTVSGQITYVNKQVTEHIEYDDWYDEMYVGFGSGFGHRRHGGYWGWGFSTGPRSRTIEANNATVSINAFGDGIGLNCTGLFNYRQKNGTLDCQFTNGMKFRGTLQRILTK